LDDRPDPKAPAVAPVLAEWDDCHTLERVAEGFVQLVHETGRLALTDARTHIRLAHKEFIQS